MSTETKGHAATAPGLRGHSCGADYPFSIVGLGYPKTRWQVQNLVTGVTFGSADSYAQAQILLTRAKTRGRPPGGSPGSIAPYLFNPRAALVPPLSKAIS